MFITRTQVTEALSRLGRQLVLAHTRKYAFLICGGSALNLAGLVERPTRDVDVLGLVEGTEADLLAAELLPDEVLRAARTVAAEINLQDDWLNDSASVLHQMRLPEGILKRAQRREFGPALTVYVIGRQDQVALKLYAALDRAEGQRHLRDLDAIEPTRAEMEFAVRWLLDRETSLEFRRAVRKIVEAFGFQNLRAFTGAKSKPLQNHPKGKPKSIKLPKN